MKYVVLVIAIMTMTIACDTTEERPARAKYNDGIAKLAASDFEKAESTLLDARSSAGVDPELRFRAAYNLGLAYAGHAEKLKDDKEHPDLKKALELEQQAAWWFGDAQRLMPADKSVADNLAVVRARVQAMSDELRKSEGKLEVRLDALIEQQRTVLVEARAAWREVRKTGGADPLAQKDVMTGLADRSRGIVAEAGVISDLAADEIDVIAKKAEDKRDDKEKMRLAQLKNLDGYIGVARSRISETRRELQQLSADTALAKAEAALAELKRAREQLDDPITVLQHVLQDQAEIDRQIATIMKADPNAPIDKWLEFTAIANRETGLHDRVDQVHAMLQGALDGKDKVTDEKQKKQLAQVEVAMPHVTAASAAQQAAHDRALDKQWKPARDEIRTAMLELFAAIEQFADLKHTVDLAWQKHQGVQAMLQPVETGSEVSPAERGKQVHDEIAANLARVERIKALIADAVTEAKAPPPADPSQPPPKPEDAEKQKQAAEQHVQMLAHAEELRGQAATQLAEFAAALDKPDATHDPVALAKTADGTLYELRKLFFDIVEHLQELIREQAETRERTNTAGGLDDISRESQLPDLVTRQDGHGVMAKAITDALAAQADAASKQPKQQEGGPNFAGAAEEVRAAGNDMSDAKATLDKAKAPAAQSTQSVSLDPATKSQGTAIEHLQRALQLLQPPPKQQDQKQDPKDDKKDPKDDKDKKDKQDQQQQQQGGAGQKAREDDAKRQKAKQDRTKEDPVDQDW